MTRRWKKEARVRADAEGLFTQVEMLQQHQATSVPVSKPESTSLVNLSAGQYGIAAITGMLNSRRISSGVRKLSSKYSATKVVPTAAKMAKRTPTSRYQLPERAGSAGARGSCATATFRMRRRSRASVMRDSSRLREYRREVCSAALADRNRAWWT